MKQSNFMSFIESMINIVVGFGISCAAQAVFLPMLGVPIPWDANLAFAVIMTVISLMRSFVLRRVFEALHIRRPLSPTMQAAIAERFRQIEVEGWTAEHDDQHATGELAQAAASYALYSARQFHNAHASSAGDVYTLKPLPHAEVWPWSETWWKPADFRRNIVKAIALLIAEGERFDRRRRRPSIPQTGSGVR